MKKIILGLLAGVAVVSTTHATTYSSKNFLMARNTLSNNAVASSMGHSAKKKGGFGASVSALGFYRASHNDKDLAKYFGGGLASKNTQTGVIEVNKENAASNAYWGQDIDFVSTGSKAMLGDVNLKPSREVYGVQLGYKQCLSKFVDGLWFDVDAPVVWARSTMGATITDAVANTDTGKGATTLGVADFFAGKTLTGKATAFTQDALTKLKMDNTKHTSDVQVADVSVRVGYTFLKDADYSVDANIRMMIPTGDNPTGEWMLESIAGQAGAWQIGAGLHAGFNLWRSADKKSSLDFDVCADYRYALEDTQKRVIGIYDTKGGHLSTQGRHSLLSKNVAVQVVPSANVLNLDVDVEGASQLDVAAGFSFACNNISGNLCYNLFANQAETVKLASTGVWADDTYGYAQPLTAGAAAANKLATSSYSGPIQNIGVTTSDNAVTGTAVADYNIYPSAAATPAQLTHKVVSGINYSFDTATPVCIGLVGEYEFSNGNNSAVNSWMIGGKVGICF